VSWCVEVVSGIIGEEKNRGRRKLIASACLKNGSKLVDSFYLVYLFAILFNSALSVMIIHCCSVCMLVEFLVVCQNCDTLYVVIA
jgi:hypothetical protein